jgi:hypothetical protein
MNLTTRLRRVWGKEKGQRRRYVARPAMMNLLIVSQSSEYESSSEEEKPKVQFRPVFVPKCV